MSLAYGALALVSLCMVGVCVIADKKRDIWLLLLFVSVSICNLGYFMLSVSRSLGAALNSNRIAYLGSVFLPFFMLMMVLRFCGIRRSKPWTIFLVALGILMLGITASPGILPIYYSSVAVETVGGNTRLIREYGPLHTLYYIYLIGYMLTMIIITLYAIAKRKIKSRSHTALLLCAVFSSVVVWLMEQFLPRGFEFLSLSYVLDEILLLAVYRSLQKQGLMQRDGNALTYTVNVLLTVFLLLFANFLRVVTEDTTPVLYVISHIVVLMIYLGILISWGVSVYDRIINRRLRRYLVSLVALMMLWMLLRTPSCALLLRVPRGTVVLVCLLHLHDPHSSDLFPGGEAYWSARLLPPAEAVEPDVYPLGGADHRHIDQRPAPVGLPLPPGL